MSYIQPNSTIEFFSDLNLSQDYNDSLYFETAPLRDIYFTNIPKLAVADRCYYARDNRGFVRVELPIGTMMHAQYMRFKNTSYENNWWYAFVKDVVYINDHTVEVQFELDILMSYMGEFTLLECYVERQHSETDGIGDNIVDEDFNTGEYVNLNALSETGDASDSHTAFFNNENATNWKTNNGWVYMVFISQPLVQSQPTRSALGVYNGLSVYIYPNTEYGIASMEVTTHAQDIFGDVVSIILVPEKFIPKIPNYDVPIYDGAVDYGSINRSEVPYTVHHTIPKSFVYLGGKPPSSGGDGYMPKNNKMYTYPYNFLAVSNSEGDEAIYQYELFKGNNCTFHLTASYTQTPEIDCVPYNYRMYGRNLDESIKMKHFPMAGWSSDLFMAYVAQSLSTLPVDLSSAGMSKLISNVSGSESDTMTKAESDKLSTQVNSSLKEGVSHFLQPMKQVGETSTDVNTIVNKKDFYFFRRTVRPEYARMIDNYFTMFGYADKTVHIPNMNARTRFTYVKTIGCKLHCACPASDADFIEQLFNKGIRFWKNHLDIGKYSSPNPPNPKNEGE